MSDLRRVTIRDLQAVKDRGERFAMLTAYDEPSARLLEEAGISVLLVGDTVGDNVLGHPNTVAVDLETMLHHTRAVVRGSGRALVVADLPFGAYGISVEQGLRSAVRLVQDGGAGAVKAEGAGPVVELAERAVRLGIPFMGHLGLMPQSVHQTGYRVQGRGEAAEVRLLDDALRLEDAGAFAVVLEAVPAEVARAVTERLSVPTIGIGAGPDTVGQVLVLHDLLGLAVGEPPRFARRYADLSSAVVEAVTAYREDVEHGRFPSSEHTYR